jgi:hypothetical protein
LDFIPPDLFKLKADFTESPLSSLDFLIAEFLANVIKFIHNILFKNNYKL